MRGKIFRSPGPVSRTFLLLTMLLFSAGQIGCNNSNTAETSAALPEDWFTVDIKFKPNTSAETRDQSIRGIEGLLLDSVRALISGGHPDFSPSVNISRDPLKDSLRYFLSIGYNKISPPPAAALDTISNPRCICNHGCGVCLMINQHFNDTTSPYHRDIDSIAFLGQ